jgi:Domain of unknown function (DUF4928)
MTGDLTFTLQEFTKDRKFNRKGPLSVALVVTQQARNMGLPLDSEKLLTEGGGQVLGLGKSAVQAILHRHGIERVLAAEGGRTSRGSISNMREYVTLLNRIHGDGPVDLQAIEAFWLAHVQEFFAAKPFRVRLDASSSFASCRPRHPRASRGKAEGCAWRLVCRRGHAAHGWRETGLRSRAREIPAQQLHDLGRAVWPQRRLLRRRRGDPRHDIAWGSGDLTLQ